MFQRGSMSIRMRKVIALCALSVILFVIYNTGMRYDARQLSFTFDAKSVSRPIRKRTHYAPRVNMGKCEKTFGKIIVFVAVDENSYKTKYHVAQESLKCYLKSTDYEFKLVDLDHDERVNRLCKHKRLVFKKHCAASVYLADADWILVLDADTGVVNPNHCIEEWIDDRVDLVFYERFFNWEVACGNYLAKNTEFSRNFLMTYADLEFTQPDKYGSDNGALMNHLLQAVLPDAKAEIQACENIWSRATNYSTYMAYVTCVKINLGANRLFRDRLRILRRGHGWVRDSHLTEDAWSETDFFIHGWKKQAIGESGWASPFSRMFNVSECAPGGYGGWNWRSDKRRPLADIRTLLANFEASQAKNFETKARIHPYLLEPDVGLCYPHCDDDTWNS